MARRDLQPTPPPPAPTLDPNTGVGRTSVSFPNPDITYAAAKTHIANMLAANQITAAEAEAQTRFNDAWFGSLTNAQVFGNGDNSPYVPGSANGDGGNGGSGSGGGGAAGGGGGAGSGGSGGVGSGAPGSAPNDPTRSAEALIRSKLDEYGLGGLSKDALEMLRQGYGWDYILLQMRDSQVYKDRFKGMEARRSRGLPAISEADYIAYERGLQQLFREVDMPAEFQSRDYFAELIGKDISYREVTQRVTDGYQRAINSPPEVLAQLKNLYGVDRGKLAAFFLDPKKTNDSIIREFSAARLSGAGVSTGFGALTKMEAEGLARSGITDSQATEGLSALAGDSPLFTDLPGGGVDPAISRADQLDSTFRANNPAKKRIEDRRRSRLSQYGGGGSLAGSQSGLSALGSSRS